MDLFVEHFCGNDLLPIDVVIDITGLSEEELLQSLASPDSIAKLVEIDVIVGITNEHDELEEFGLDWFFDYCDGKHND